MTYDELSKLVNTSYAKTKDIRVTAKETGVSFNEVWDMLGFKDYFDFEETENEQMGSIVAVLIAGWCIWMFIRHPLRSVSFLIKLTIMSVFGVAAFLGFYYFMMKGGF